MCDQPFTEGCQVRIMPDVHAGKGCTIGTTMTITDKAVPNVVGVDIGCGMYTVDWASRPIDLPAFDEACHAVPSGPHVWEGRRERFDLEELRCFRQLKDTKRLERSLGTLGGGNHFIEVDRAADGTNYLVIHSGSRNLGTQVASYYQQLAVDLHQGKEEYFVKRDALIAEYKATGRRSQIQQALKQLAGRTSRAPTCRRSSAGWRGPTLRTTCTTWRSARSMRASTARRWRRSSSSVLASMPARRFHTIHNYIDTDEMILRKGAIAAHEGELVLIPLNMRDGSVLARGRGNADWNFSAPHGAGRVMSRTAARETLSLEEYRAQMAGASTPPRSARRRSTRRPRHTRAWTTSSAPSPSR